MSESLQGLKKAQNQQVRHSLGWLRLFGRSFWVLWLGYSVLVGLMLFYIEGVISVQPFVMGLGIGLFYVMQQGLSLERFSKNRPSMGFVILASVIRFVVAAGLIVWASQGDFLTSGWILLGFFAQHVALLGSQVWQSRQVSG